MEQKMTFVRSAVLLACLAAMGGVSAQTVPGPWTCGPEMYVGRGGAGSPTGFFTYDMGAAGPWGDGAPIGSLDAGNPGSKDFNALAYNPRDNYLYAMKRDTTEVTEGGVKRRIGLYRIGKEGTDVKPVEMNPHTGSFKEALRIEGLPAGSVQGSSATFDRLGNYFMVQGSDSDVYVIRDVHALAAQADASAPPVTVTAEKLPREKETDAEWLKDGFEALVPPAHAYGTRLITDFAASPRESTHAQPVLYGMGDQVGGKWYLHRYRVDLASKKIYVSRKEITGMGTATGYMASAAFRRDGKLFLYPANGKVYEIDADPASASKWTVVAGPIDAKAANASDGASCMTSIQAENDGDNTTPFMSVSNGAVQESSTSVLGNDKSDLQPIVLSGTEQNATVVSGSWKPAGGTGPAAGSITLDPATGKVTVAQGTTPGTYTYKYEICSFPAATPKAACAEAEVVIKVTEEPISPKNDDYGTVGVGPDPLPDSVVGNDTVAGVLAVLEGAGKNAQLKPGSWKKISGPATDKPSLDYANGQVTVPEGTPPGDYVYEYELCADAGAPCKKAQVTFKVVALLADNESFGEVSPGTTIAESIYTGDTVDGAPVVIGANAKLKPNSWAPKAPDSVPALPVGSTQTNQLTLNADGKVVVPSNAAPGDYTYNYTICLATPNDHICKTAEVKLKVKSSAPSLPSIDAKDDDWQATPLVAGKSTTGSIFTNDLVGSANVAIGTNANLKGDWQPDAGNPAGGQGKLSLKGDGTIEAAKDAPAGIYEFDYAICLTSSSTTCDLAKVTVKVEAAKIAALDDVFDNVAPGGATPSILTNDLVDGQQASLSADWELDVGSWLVVDHPPGAKALSLNNDGTVEVPSDTPEGTYRYRYRICRKAAPAECDWALFTLRLRGAAGAGAVTPVPVGAPWALGLAALGMLGVARRVRQRRK